MSRIKQSWIESYPVAFLILVFISFPWLLAAGFAYFNFAFCVLRPGCSVFGMMR